MHLLTVRHIVPKAKLDLQKLQDKLKAARRKPSTYQVGGSFTNIYELLIAPTVLPCLFYHPNLDNQTMCRHYKSKITDALKLDWTI